MNSEATHNGIATAAATGTRTNTSSSPATNLNEALNQAQHAAPTPHPLVNGYCRTGRNNMNGSNPTTMQDMILLSSQ